MDPPPPWAAPPMRQSSFCPFPPLLASSCLYLPRNPAPPHGPNSVSIWVAYLLPSLACLGQSCCLRWPSALCADMNMPYCIFARVPGQHKWLMSAQGGGAGWTALPLDQHETCLIQVQTSISEDTGVLASLLHASDVYVRRS